MHHLSWKLFLLTAILSTASFAESETHKDLKDMATPCPPPLVLKDGTYMGIQVGYNSYKTHDYIAPIFPFIQSSVVTANNGWAIGALLGYGKTFRQWMYLGGEVYANSNFFDQTLQIASPGALPGTYVNEFYSGPVFGLSLLPGIKLTDTTLTFVRLGWNRGLLKTKETSTFLFSNNHTNFSSGLVIGVGMETLITTNYSLRAEFDHMYFSTYTTRPPYSTRVTPSANQFMLSAIYHF